MRRRTSPAWPTPSRPRRWPGASRRRAASSASTASRWPSAGRCVNGVVDVLAHERGGAQLVVDYKTDGLDPATDLAAYVAERYAIQRRVYALAALRGGAARVEVAYAFLERPLEPLSETFEATDAERLEAELLELAAGMLAGEYPVTDRPHRDLCLTCPGRRALCSYSEELTLRENAG